MRLRESLTDQSIMFLLSKVRLLKVLLSETFLNVAKYSLPHSIAVAGRFKHYALLSITVTDIATDDKPMHEEPSTKRQSENKLGERVTEYLTTSPFGQRCD